MAGRQPAGDRGPTVKARHPAPRFRPLRATDGTAITHSSYSGVFGISHDREHDEEIRPGDLVATGANFEVPAVNGDRAWVRNVPNGANHLALLNRVRRVGGELLAMAAE